MVLSTLSPIRFGRWGGGNMTTEAELSAQLYAARAALARYEAAAGDHIRTPDEAVTNIRRLIDSERETFVVALLNSRQQVLTTRIVALGSLSEVGVHPREVFKDAVRMSAHSIIVAHNHPSEDTTPSDADLELTERLEHAGEILGIPVVDHLIVTRREYLSFAEQGLMNR